MVGIIMCAQIIHALPFSFYSLYSSNLSKPHVLNTTCAMPMGQIGKNKTNNSIENDVAFLPFYIFITFIQKEDDHPRFDACKNPSKHYWWLHTYDKSTFYTSRLKKRKKQQSCYDVRSNIWPKLERIIDSPLLTVDEETQDR